MKKRKTNEIIMENFSRLLSEKEYDEITVTDIICESGISRSTFYRCFIDKRDVLEHIFSTKMLKINFYDFSRNICEREKECVEFLLNERNFWIHALEVPFFYSLWEKEAFGACYKYCSGIYGESPQLWFLCRVLGAGFVSINLEMLKGKLNITPEELGRSFQNIINLYANQLGH